MKKIKIMYLERFCKKLFKRYKECKNRPNGGYWAKYYYDDYKKAKNIREQIESMSSTIKEGGVFGKTYIVEVNTLEEYFDLYKMLTKIPKSEIEIGSPNNFYILEENNDFCQVE